MLVQLSGEKDTKENCNETYFSFARQKRKKEPQEIKVKRREFFKQSLCLPLV
jgi:hypothetical protein